MCLVVAADGSSVVFSSVRRLIYVNSSACRFPSEQGCSLLLFQQPPHTTMNDIHHDACRIRLDIVDCRGEEPRWHARR